MKTKKYAGVVVPMVTPVNEDGSLDTLAVERIITSFADNGVSPLLMGTTGEGNSVSRDDALLLVETAVKARSQWALLHGECSMIVYVNLTGNCFSEQLKQAEAYTQAGADVITATLPTYYALTAEQMENYYRCLADNITGPLMLYNILATTHMSIPLDVISRLADHPNIVGIKDSERDLERMEKCIDIARGRSDFAYFCGCAAHSARALELGGDGIVPSTGNIEPGLYSMLYEAAIAGNKKKACELQELTDRMGRVYQEGRTLGQSLAALKIVMETKNLCEPWMLLPLTRLSNKEEESIRRDYRLFTATEKIKLLKKIRAELIELKGEE